MSHSTAFYQAAERKLHKIQYNKVLANYLISRKISPTLMSRITIHLNVSETDY